MEKIILTDCDGCLVLWNDGFNRFAASKGLPQLPNTDAEYRISMRHGITSEYASALVKEFNESSQIADLEPFADSVEYIAKLADKGFRFIVVTSIGDAVHAHHFRTKNLTTLFGDVFDKIICLGQGAPKAHILTQWAGSGYFWVEDHVNNAIAGHEAGLNTMLIRHPYNSHYDADSFTTVSNATPWEEIYSMVCEKYKIL